MEFEKTNEHFQINHIFRKLIDVIDNHSRIAND